jgi:hypothetical protein
MRKALIAVLMVVGVIVLGGAYAAAAQDPCEGELVCQRPDGTVQAVVDYLLTGGLKHPETYQPLNWDRLFVSQATGYWVVRHRWQAKNDFGMPITSTYIFVLDIYGEVIETIDGARR